MYYHAIRVSSVAMCNTWVWDASGLFSGLPLMFPFFPSMFRKGPDVGSLAYMFRKGSLCFEVSSYMFTFLPDS